MRLDKTKVNASIPSLKHENLEYLVNLNSKEDLSTSMSGDIQQTYVN